MPTALSKTAKESLDGLLAKATGEGRVPGAFFAVTSTTDGIIYSGSAGFKAFNHEGAGKVDADSIFWICSMTKLVVSVAILQLIERGKISLDTPVASIVPELANPVVVDDPLALEYSYRPAQHPILVRHILTHSSGIHYAVAPHRKHSPNDLGRAYNGISYEGDHSPAKFFELIKHGLPSVPLAFEPGTSWAYGWNLEIATLIIERLENKTIEEYCQEHIFDPLDMKSATFLLTDDVKNKLVELTYRRPDGALERWNNQLRLIEQDPEKAKGMLLGGIGIYSNLIDYLKFLRHLLQSKDNVIENPILSASSVNSLFEPSVPPHCTAKIKEFTQWEACSFGNGLCVALEDWPKKRRAGSGFWYGWAGTYFFMDPASGIAVVYGTQLVPTQDKEVVRLWEQLEEALYTGIHA